MNSQIFHLDGFTFSLFIYRLIDIWAVSPFDLLTIANQDAVNSLMFFKITKNHKITKTSLRPGALDMPTVLAASVASRKGSLLPL